MGGEQDAGDTYFLLKRRETLGNMQSILEEMFGSYAKGDDLVSAHCIRPENSPRLHVKAGIWRSLTCRKHIGIKLQFLGRQNLWGSLDQKAPGQGETLPQKDKVDSMEKLIHDLHMGVYTYSYAPHTHTYHMNVHVYVHIFIHTCTT